MAQSKYNIFGQIKIHKINVDTKLQLEKNGHIKINYGSWVYK